MILADKIIKERKKLGLSQEELAEKMNVSRQAVSKWEGAQSMPDIEKILQLSKLFGVTTDYLLKDDIENEENIGQSRKQCETASESFSEEKRFRPIQTITAEKPGVFPVNNKTVSIGASDDDVKETRVQTIRTVTMEQAENFLSERKAAARNIAVGTFLCFLSVVPLFILSGMSESPIFNLSENAAGELGLTLMLIIIAAAVGLFVYTGFKNSPYEFLEKEPFETEYGVTKMVKEQKDAFSGTYAKFNIIGIILCILSPVSLFIGAFSENEFKAVVSLAIMLVIAGIGVIFFILAGVRHESMQKLLKEGDYSEAKKKEKGIKGTVAVIYWLAATAVYLLLLFLAGDQESGWRNNNSWIIWPVSGVLFPAVMALCGIFEKKNKSE